MCVLICGLSDHPHILVLSASWGMRVCTTAAGPSSALPLINGGGVLYLG